MLIEIWFLQCIFRKLIYRINLISLQHFLHYLLNIVTFEHLLDLIRIAFLCDLMRVLLLAVGCTKDAWRYHVVLVWLFMLLEDRHVTECLI